MKKKWFVPMALLAVVLFASCDSKLCYCYDHTSSGTVYEQEIFVNTDTPCSAMSNGDRGCVESYERMDPGQVAKTPDC